MEIAKTADQALVVLLHLAEHGASAPAEIARATGLNRTVVHRLLATLHGRGFVLKRGERFAVGPVAARVAGAFQPELRATARAALAAVADAVGETLVFAVPDGTEAVVADQVVSRNRLVRAQYDLGFRHPLHIGATGLAILAFLPQAEAAPVLAHAPDAAALGARLDRIRRDAYSITHNEMGSGESGLAVPVFDGFGDVVGSIGVVVPGVDVPDLDAHIPALRKAADRIRDHLAKG
ncbi:IclR family transcriptional regulator [Nonomuraea sp. 10N515B]|uniref:IclR family transcriptional regulator n=1 Tax=Nonomuraea sp. 10N515B TaxID=3457422 RepID=UPI003FCD5638